MPVDYTDECSCSGIVSTRGEKGDTGATGATGTTGATGPAGPSRTTYLITKHYAAAGNDIYNGGLGYTYSILGALPAGSNVIFTATFTLEATAAHNVTIYIVIDGVPDSTFQHKQTCGSLAGSSKATITVSGYGAYTVGNSFAMQIISDGAAATPVLKTASGHFYVI